MQKKLLALAVASLAWAPLAAQADVTLTGNMDLGVTMSEAQAGGVTTKTTTIGNHNGSSTSNVAITATEDLGGGMSGKVYIETDPAFGSNAGGTFAGAPNWLQLSGSFGSITLGYMNNYALAASSASQPMGTAVGSGYSGGFGRLDGVNVIGDPAAATVGGAGARDIRINRSIQYAIPSQGGFSAGIIYKMANSDAGNSAADRTGQMQIGVGYSAGPLNIAFANSTIEREGGAIVGTSADLTHMMLGVNYKLGALTLMGGFTTSEAANSADVDSSSWNVALKYAMSPVMSVMVNVLEVDDGRVANVDRDLFGLGLDYTMSKRTTAYLRYESGDNNSASAAAGDFSTLAAGIRHTF